MSEDYKEITNNKKPRVNITYEVETGQGKISKELPFVVGVMSDLSGNSSKNKKPVSERKFIQIDQDNFDEVIKRIGPELNFTVENKLTSDNSEIPIHLEFNSIEDFEPEKIAEQIPILKQLIATRNKLNELITQVDRSEKLESLLEDILENNLFIEE